MNDVNESTEHHAPKRWYRNEMVLFVSGSIVVAFSLVVLGLGLYVSSGADLLDLSRPGYTSVRGEVNQSDTFKSFPSSGPVTQAVLDEFLTLYDKQTLQVMNDDVFSVSTLEDQTLGIDEPAAGE